MVNLVLLSKLLFQVKTVYRINSTYEDGSVEVEENNIWGNVKLLIKNCAYYAYLVIEW